ncbi:MAG: MGMT family protein [Deltaproteobacteria bacterium]|nr:MGMT family protein [Deltaproteobacteria bacterium]
MRARRAGRPATRRRPVSRGGGFPEEVEAIVGAIPVGRVLSYGDVARLTGRPRAARAVAAVLRGLPPDSLVPWHRVVSQDGTVPSGGRETWAAIQRAALVREGVTFDDAGRVVMDRTAFTGRIPSPQARKGASRPPAGSVRSGVRRG